jgi:hypothetical protein
VTKDEATARARTDLAGRERVTEAEITVDAVADAVYPDAALGAYLEDEMAADVLTNGWRITLSGPDGKAAEYRASAEQLRLYQYNGENYKI